MGKTWVRASKGLFDTRVSGVFVVDTNGDHLYVGTPSGIWESTDAAGSWNFVPETKAFGRAVSFRNGTINGESYVLVGTSQGIANVPTKGGNWSVIESPRGAWQNGPGNPLSVSDVPGTTVVAGCLGGTVHIGTIKNTSYAEWEEFPAMKCLNVAIDPNDRNHLIFSHADRSPSQVSVSTDGGKSSHSTNFTSGAYYVAIDRFGWYCKSSVYCTVLTSIVSRVWCRYYTGAEPGAFRSIDGGETW
jgi:hypothetical protein